MQAAQAAGVDVQALRLAQPRRHEWPFDAERKRMATLHGEGAAWCAYVKGAPESVLPRCLDSCHTASALATAQEWAAQGLRVLAVAQREGRAEEADEVMGLEAEAFEQGLTLLGLRTLTRM